VFEILLDPCLEKRQFLVVASHTCRKKYSDVLLLFSAIRVSLIFVSSSTDVMIFALDSVSLHVFMASSDLILLSF
jgi:hypothetical protein